ncbi:M16 family metallopeptidase [Terrimicrobium sacchariphilum]|nr:pitrilysin family protein [Terrimicrobium sacchariphilum]
MSIALAPAKETRVVKETPVLPDNKAQSFTLPNGLTLIVEEDHSAPVASVQAWCGTGSIDEGNWMGAGLSHILEHMLFKGTEKRKSGDIARQIQDQGGYINAYTSFDRTVYWIDIPSSGVDQAIDILADAMLHSTLPEDEYVKEQEVIRREFAMGFDDPGRQSSQLMLRTVFTESPFRHPVIGYLDVYNKLKREDVFAYYKKRYVPNNLTFVVAGDVDAQKVREQVEALFKDEPRQPLEPVYVAGEPEQVGRRDVHEEFPTELTRLSLAWRIPGLTNPDTPALELLGDIMGSGRSSLLNQDLREKQQIVHSVSAGMYSLQTDGVFVIQALCDPDKREQAEKAAFAIVERIKKDGVTAAELDKARRSMLSSQLSNLGTSNGKASDLGSNWLLTKNLNFSKDYLDAIARVTPADIQRVARQYLRDDRVNVTSLNPIGSLNLKSDKEKEAANSEVKRFVLPNGLRLLVREDARLPLVSIYSTFRGGLLAETPKDNGVTKLMARTMLKGTKSRTAAQIAEQIEDVGGSIGADAGNNSFSISADVMKPDLALGLDLVADVIKNPTFPAGEVDLEKRGLLAAIKAEDEQPTAVARNAMRSSLFGTHPYALRGNGSAESVASLTPEQLKAFHDEYAVASNGVIAVFGDVKAEDVLKLVEKDFGSLPAGKLALTNPPQPVFPDKAIDTQENRPKQQAVLMFGFPGTDVLSDDRSALELINEASNDLGSRFFNRIREQMGLAYYVGAGNFMGLAPGCFLFYLGTDPKKVDRVRVEFQDEIGKLAKDGLTEEELVRAKKKLLGSEAIRNQSNSAFAAAVAIDELVGLGYDNYLKRKDQIESVTLDDTKRIAAKYLGVPGRVEVIVQPPAQAAANNPQQ